MRRDGHCSLLIGQFHRCSKNSDRLFASSSLLFDTLFSTIVAKTIRISMWPLPWSSDGNHFSTWSISLFPVWISPFSPFWFSTCPVSSWSVRVKSSFFSCLFRWLWREVDLVNLDLCCSASVLSSSGRSDSSDIDQDVSARHVSSLHLSAGQCVDLHHDHHLEYSLASSEHASHARLGQTMVLRHHSSVSLHG